MRTNKSNYLTSLDFEVVKAPVSVVYDGYVIQDKTKTALVNTENHRILSYMSNGYRLFTNQEFTALTERIQNTFDLELDHYAVHNDGKKVLSVFKKTDQKYHVGPYEFTNHIVLYDSRDGSTKLSVGGSGVLHRCMNMFTSTQVQFSVNHSYKLDEMLREFELGLESFAANQKQHLDRLANLERVKATHKDLYRLIGGWVALSPTQVKDVALGKHLGGKDKEDLISTRKTNIIQGLCESYDLERKDLGDTGFTIFNAVTNYYTHNRNKSVSDLFFGDFGAKEDSALKFAEALI